MLMKNFDFYDIYAMLIEFRAAPSYKYNAIIAKTIKDLIDAPQNDNTIESNIIRSSLALIKEIDKERYSWVFTNNIYTYGHKIIKDDLPYQILSAGFSELLICSDGNNSGQFRDLADALHNVPIILTKDEKHVEKLIKREISTYRQKWNKEFLKEIIG